MKVAVINQFYPPARAPTGLLLRDVADRLAARGHQVAVLASRSVYGQSTADEIPAEGVELHRLGPPRHHGVSRIGKAMDYLGFYWRVNQVLKRLHPRPDVLLCLTTPPFLGLMANRFRQAHGVPYVLWCMDLYPEALVANGWLRPGGIRCRWLARLGANERRGANAVIALGPDMQVLLQASLASIHAVTIPVWSTLAVTDAAKDQRQALRRERGWGDDEIVFLYSGNMGRAHSCEAFVRLAERLAAGNIKARWIFCGAGPQQKKWQALGAGRWAWHPPMDEHNAVAHLLAADVHLVSQRPEWTGVVVPSKYQTACAMGKPVVYAGPGQSAVGSWIAEGRTGWVIPDDGYAGMDQVVEELCDPAIRLEKGGNAFAQSRVLFDRETNLDHIVRLVERTGGLCHDP